MRPAAIRAHDEAGQDVHTRSRALYGCADDAPIFEEEAARDCGFPDLDSRARPCAFDQQRIER